ncbi:MAG: TonB-dependent receptor [Crocinitomicaceae bacterium]
MKFLIGSFFIFLSLSAWSQNGVKLLVISSDSLPLPFAEVYVEDYSHSFYANEFGELNLPFSTLIEVKLEVKSTGYETKIIDFVFTKKPNYIVLHEIHRHLDKVIVSAETGIQRENISSISRQKISDLSVIKSETLGEALSNIPGVDVGGIGSGVSKPVIRGLSGSSVVTYVNGLRIQNQQWGGDHGLPITSLGIGSVEVVKGPASLLYGADAMGGVLYFKDEPFAKPNSQNGYVSTRFDANTLGASTSMGYQISKNNLHISAYLGYDNFADYRLPNNEVLLNSRFNQQAGKLVVGYHQNKWLFKLNYDYYAGRIGLPGHTHESNPKPADFETENQNRGLNAPAQDIVNHFISAENQFFFNKSTVTFILGNTNNQLNEHEDKIFTPDILMNLNNSLYHVKWKHSTTKRLSFIVGSQGMYQMNRNDEQAVEFLIPDANTSDLGGYVLMNYNLLKWRFQMGGRYDTRSIMGLETSSFQSFRKQFGGFSFSSGLAYISQKMTGRLNVSSGFRSPTSSELLSNGIHHGSNRYEIGNINLLTENALQIDGSVAWHFNDLEIVINPYYNRIQNYIYIEPTNSTIDNFQVFNYKQAAYAELYGVDFASHFHPHDCHWLHMETSFSGLLATDNQNNDLPLIPQTNIKSQIGAEFSMSSKYKLENITVQYQYFFQQNRVGLYDIASRGYGLLNLNINSVLAQQNPISISAGVRNILNQEYIPHLSNLKYLGIFSPGRNIYLALKIEFNQNLKSKIKNKQL